MYLPSISEILLFKISIIKSVSIPSTTSSNPVFIKLSFISSISDSIASNPSFLAFIEISLNICITSTLSNAGVLNNTLEILPIIFTSSNENVIRSAANDPPIVMITEIKS